MARTVGYVITLHQRMRGSAVLIDPRDRAELIEQGMGRKDGILPLEEIQGVFVTSLAILRQITLERLLQAAGHFPDVKLLKPGEVARWGLRPMQQIEVEETAEGLLVFSVEGITDPETVKALPYYGEFRLEKDYALQRVPIEQIDTIAKSPPADILPAQLQDIREGGVLLMRILSFFAPLLEGMFMFLSGPEKGGKSFAMRMVLYFLRWLYLSTRPDLRVVFLSVGERGDELGEIQRLTEHPQVEFFGTSADDLPTSKWVYMSYLALERVKRHLEMGRDTWFLMDSLSRLATGFSLSMEQEARVTGGHTLSALVQPRAFLGVAGVYPLHPAKPSCTLLVTGLRESSKWDEQPTTQVLGTSVGDWYFTGAAHTWPKLNVANGGTSTRNLSWVDFSPIEQWFVAQLREKMSMAAGGEGGRFNAQAALDFLIKTFRNESPQKVMAGWDKIRRRNELVVRFGMDVETTRILIEEWDLSLEQVQKLVDAEFGKIIVELVQAGITRDQIADFLGDKLSREGLLAIWEKWQAEWSNAGYSAAVGTERTRTGELKTLSSLACDPLRKAKIPASLVKELIAEGNEFSAIGEVVKEGADVNTVRERLKAKANGRAGHKAVH